MISEEQRILATIPHVSAGYRCVEETKSGLLAGTRVELTQELWTWATTGFPVEDSRPIYYLSGAAGLGKSAFAYHLCRLIDQEWGLNLGASFFFSSLMLCSTKECQYYKKMLWQRVKLAFVARHDCARLEDTVGCGQGLDELEMRKLYTAFI